MTGSSCFGTFWLRQSATRLLPANGSCLYLHLTKLASFLRETKKWNRHRSRFHWIRKIGFNFANKTDGFAKTGFKTKPVSVSRNWALSCLLTAWQIRSTFSKRDTVVLLKTCEVTDCGLNDGVFRSHRSAESYYSVSDSDCSSFHPTIYESHAGDISSIHPLIPFLCNME